MEQEFLSYEEAIANKVVCDWDKRQKCDSFYIEKYNNLAKKVFKVLQYAKKNKEFNDSLKGTMLYEDVLNDIYTFIIDTLEKNN